MKYYLRLLYPCLGFQHEIFFHRQHDIRQFVLTTLAWNDWLHSPSRLRQWPETFCHLFLELVPAMYVKNALIVIIKKQELVVQAIAS